MGIIITRTLQCGMPLIVERMSGVKSAGITWLVPNGCGRDPAGKQGLSSMWAEIIMRGAGPLSSREHADALDRLGVTRSAEPRVFTLRFAATLLGERLKDALSLIVDVVRSPRMEESAVDPCRDLSLQTLASLKDDPQERAALEARARHHPDPLCRSGLGTEDGLNAITREDLTQLWHTYARPRGSIFAAAGMIDVDDLERRLNDLLAGWDGQAADPEVGSVPVRGYGHIRDPSNQVQIFLMHDAPAENHPDSLLEKIAMTVLSGGMAGRLFTEIREKRALCYSVNATYAGDRDHGTVSAYVGTSPDRAQESLDVLCEELFKLKTPQGAVTLDEFSRATVQMKSSLVFSGESTAARAVSLAYDHRRIGRSRSLEELAAAIDAVTLDQLNDYLLRRLMGRWTIQTLGPAPLTPPAAG